jgi:hypothetical protein
MKNFISQLRQAIIIGSAFLCALLSAHSFFLAAIHIQSILSNIIFGALLLGLAFGIFRQYRWALRLAAAMCLFVIVLLPIGLFNPFTAGDYMVAGMEPPSVIQTLLWLIPLEALLLAIVFIIDPKKKRTDDEPSA